MPGAWDALSARLALRAGFDTVFLSGYCTAGTLLGMPDTGYLTQTEMAEVARRVCGANPELMVVVDADTGYGNPLNTVRTVQLWEQAGAAGLFLEDQVWPKRCGHMEGKRVVPLDEYLPKLRAALRTRGSTPFHVTARTDARAAIGLDEAIVRARAFADVGADAVFVEAPQSVAEMAAVRAALPPDVVLVANMVEAGKTPVRPLSELGATGYRMVVFPVAGVLAAAHALGDVYAALHRDGTTASARGSMLAFDALNALLGLEELYRREREWLRRD